LLRIRRSAEVRVPTPENRLPSDVRADERFAAGVIVRLYRLAYARNPDLDGFASMLRGLREGRSLATLAAEVLRASRSA
jgi:hypothetical protein